MPHHVCHSAGLACSMGLAPSTLVVMPVNCTLTGNQPAANIMDHVALVNILPFGMCTAPANPAVIAATSAALGTPTPAPCMPATPAPWIPGAPTVLLGNQPALDETCKLMCTWLGVISVTFPGQATHLIP